MAVKERTFAKERMQEAHQQIDAIMMASQERLQALVEAKIAAMPKPAAPANYAEALAVSRERMRGMMGRPPDSNIAQQLVSDGLMPEHRHNHGPQFSPEDVEANEGRWEAALAVEQMDMAPSREAITDDTPTVTVIGRITSTAITSTGAIIELTSPHNAEDKTTVTVKVKVLAKLVQASDERFSPKQAQDLAKQWVGSLRMAHGFPLMVTGALHLGMTGKPSLDLTDTPVHIESCR